MREKVGKSRNTVFSQWSDGRKVGSPKRRVRSQLARWEMKNCTPLWREAHFRVKMYKTHQLQTTFGSWDVEKVHAVVARSTFPSQNVQNRDGGHIRPWKRVTFAPEPKGVTFAPEPQYFQYGTQPFRVKPGDKGTFRGTGEPLGGTWGHKVTCLCIQYVAQPFRVKPGDKGTFRGTGEPLGGTRGNMVTCLSIQYVTQPFRVKPWDKGTFRGTGEPLGGTRGHMVTCLSIQYVTQPFRV